MWKIIDTGRASAEANMAIDAKLLENLADTKQRILHLYEWERPSITHGYFLDPSKYLNINNLNKYSVVLARRPTGGGIVFHFSDLAFSILIPASDSDYSTNTLANYAFVNGLIKQLLEKTLDLPKPLELLQTCCDESSFSHCCMAHPVQYDVMYEGKKIAGGAQRRTRHGFLHQGTIHLGKPNRELMEDIVHEKALIRKIETLSFSCDSKRDEIIKRLHTINFIKACNVIY